MNAIAECPKHEDLARRVTQNETCINHNKSGINKLKIKLAYYIVFGSVQTLGIAILVFKALSK